MPVKAKGKAKMRDINQEIKDCEDRLGIARRVGDKQREAEILRHLGAIYSTIPEKIDTAKAIACYKEAIIIFRRYSDWLAYYGASLALGFIYEILLHDSQTALRIYQDAIRDGGAVLDGSWEDGKRKDILLGISRTKADLRRAE